MDWSASPTTTSSAGGMVSSSLTGIGSCPASSRTSTYCAWLVSWYSSTMTCRNRLRYSAATSGNAWSRLTVTMIRSSKSIAPAATSRR